SLEETRQRGQNENVDVEGVSKTGKNGRETPTLAAGVNRSKRSSPISRLASIIVYSPYPHARFTSFSTRRSRRILYERRRRRHSRRLARRASRGERRQASSRRRIARRGP